MGRKESSLITKRKKQFSNAAAASRTPPRASKRKTTSTPIEPQRQAQKCQKCPGRPLRAQCEHTKRGKEYLARQAALNELEDDSDNESSSDSSNSNVGPGPSTSLAFNNAGPSTPDIFASASTPASHSVVATPTPASARSGNMGVLTSSHLAQLSARTGSTTSASLSSASASSSRQARRTSARDPYNGFVEGAYRGSEIYQIVRGHALPSPIADNTRAVRRFMSTINSIVEKCEDLSRQTSCWLFIGAQHSTARSPAISYASPRLRRDAAEQENADLQRQLDQSRLDAQQMAQSLEKAAQTQKELDKQLKRYQRIHGLL
ncbi:hypothetical protein JR316_0006700 [Psilocybe cubensis]|uniref:Uncharacterized protein n=2 Tax=Psilocybe cubensis TaxID=181762 RepID=A0A8H7XP92_PSICU|nr:hypothetical protein JR316_0006700 [Psilocybe cubensis]KAH9480103.1 hypothetical protein JR316_0006700 [Psilocybe cubensis]